ncbi:MAG: ABC transporter permease [Clostridia bacterium]|nr:ABC transporter permease [Clostridia bacterium]
MENTKSNERRQSRFLAFFTGSTFKALLPFLGLVLIVVGMNILTGGKLLTPKRIRLLLSQVYYPAIVATGVFFIMTLGSIDFTEGSTLGVASIVISVISTRLDSLGALAIPLAILGGILTGAAIGAFNGFVHVKFKLPSFIVTICTMYLFRGVCAYLTTETAVPASSAIKALDEDWIKITVTLAVLAIAFFLFQFTRIGTDVKAVGSGETAARFSGVRTNRVKFLAFVAAGALTGLAAFVNVIKVGSITSTAGNQLETQILISLVLGGLPITGGAKVRFSNIIVGTLMYTVLNNGLVMLGFESATQQLIKGLVFLLFVALTIDRKALKVIK